MLTSIMVAAIVACGAAPATAQPPDPTPVVPPTPVWTECPRAAGFECATVTAPLDYRHPELRTIELAVIRHRATDPAHRIGSLLFNPGGPGPAIDLFPIAYRFIPREMRERFDIVSWDPRGFGRSTAVQCFARSAQYAAWSAQLPTGFPVGREQEQQWIERNAELGRHCEQRDPELLRFVSTTDQAHDLDLLRAVLGDERLTYLGVSYGSLLGATYANLFPDRVRAMVLDGNIDPTAWYDDNPALPTFLRENSDLGTAETLTQFLDLCGRAGRSGCPFAADNASATRDKYELLLDRLRTHPQGIFTYAVTASAVRAALYLVQFFMVGAANWLALAELLQALWQGKSPQSTTRLAMLPTMPSEVIPYPLAHSSPPAPEREQHYLGIEQFYALVCSESPNPRDPYFYDDLAESSTLRAGTIGPTWSWTTEACSTWPGRAAHRYTGPWNRSTTPILTLNNTYDPATPYRDGQAMTAELGNARLLTVAGYGHTTLINPNNCAIAHENNYLVRGVLPPPDTVCQPDTPPFTRLVSDESTLASAPPG
ncbi:alpha/beta hydrolase [Nocardia vaccinii]|uniref:alpha/beta hydrolase n=1 Tax=Nocardia vaccinii TaxID=1822 RepID=UPI00082DA1F0|nr:alpha/beta hydrolase [Nocardia vaccinii]